MIIEELTKMGYTATDPWDAVSIFEKELGKYTGARHVVALDSCSNSIFLCLKYLGITDQVIELPARTYSSVPMQIIHSGNRVRFVDKKWWGDYQIGDTPIVDCATRLLYNMYRPYTYTCVSFHHRKILKLGRGGAILTDDDAFADWCRPMIYDGRHKYTQYDSDTLACIGYHMYMTPEDALRALKLLLALPRHNDSTGSYKSYTDLREQKIFEPYCG